MSQIAPIADIDALMQSALMYQPNSMARRITRKILVGVATGAVIAVSAIFMSILSGAAGHGSYIAARMLFPFSMLLTRLEGSIGPIAMTVGLLQFPLYGALIARAAAVNDYRAAFLVAAAHLVAVLACFSGLLGNFS